MVTIKNEEKKKRVGKNSYLSQKWVVPVLIVLFPMLIGSQFAERNIISIPGKEGFLYFDHKGNLNVVYINSKGGISLATAEEGHYAERIATREIDYTNHVNFVRARKDKAGKTWIVWEERESGKSDIYVAQLRNKKLVHPTKATTNREGFNFSPCIDFSYGNDLWMVWVNYFQKKYLVLVKNLSTDQTWEINSSSTSSALSPQIVIDGTEKIWTFWVGQLQNRDEILYTHFDGERWINPLSLNQHSDVPHINPSISLDFNGFPHIVWSAYDGDDYELYYSYWDGNKWIQEKRLTNNHNIADTSPCISLFLGAIPIVVWLKSQNEKNEVCLTYRMDDRWISEIIISEEKSIVNPLKIVSLDSRIGVLWEVESEIRARLLHFYELYEPFFVKAVNIRSPRILTLDGDKYIGFGNSITYGVIDNTGAPEKGYIPRLEKLIDENIKDSEVINRGVGGEKTSGGLSRINSVINEDQAKTIFLMEGINDVKDETISMDTAAFNLERLVERCLEFEMTIFLASLIPKDPWEGMIKERVLDLNEKIKSIASDLNIYFVDQFQAFGSFHSGALFSDATHPNEQGYQLMADTWYKALTDTLPFMEIEPTSLYFEAEEGGSNPPPQTFKIRNSGEGNLRYQIHVDQEWISASPSNGESRGEWDEIELSINISNLSWGTHQAVVTILADYTPNSPQVLTVDLLVSIPIIQLSTTSLSFEGIKGESNPPPQTFKIRNSGKDILFYQISDNRGWISVSPTSGDSQGEWDDMEVSVNISNLSRGSYQGQVIISSERASNSPQAITIKLTVFGPMISLDKSSVSFEAVAGEANPSPQEFKIKNSGEGTLRYQISTDKDWITVSAESGDSKGEWDFIQVSVDISHLSKEDNQGQIIITAPDASNSPQMVNVSLHIQFPPLFPPLNFHGEKKKNRSLSQLEYINVLTWEANPQNKFIEKYRIYFLEEGSKTLLMETDTHTFEYWHRRVEKDKVYMYGLTAQDKFGRESEPVHIEVR